MQAHQKEDGHYNINNSVRYEQSDRHMGQHKIEGATAASEGKSLLMTDTHNTQCCDLDAALSEPFFLQCNLEEARRLISCLDLPLRRAVPLHIDDCCHCLDEQLEQILFAAVCQAK